MYVKHALPAQDNITPTKTSSQAEAGDHGSNGLVQPPNESRDVRARHRRLELIPGPGLTRPRDNSGILVDEFLVQLLDPNDASVQKEYFGNREEK